LLSKGIPVDIDCGLGTPLFHAANNGKDKTLKILLDHKADACSCYYFLFPLLFFFHC
jgi:ankyrin repeat protein